MNTSGLKVLVRTLHRAAIAALVLAGAGLGSPVAAQSAGSVQGYVYQEGTLNGVSSVNVTVAGTSLGSATGQDGFYRIVGVAPGTYDLVASALGFAPDTVSVTVSAGQAAEQDLFLATAAFELEGLTVTGVRGGQVRSINDKRQALSIVDAISADEIGKLPDLNVAESAQRIPGIAIRTDRGEGRFMSIRGTAPNRNNVTFNGQVLASAAGTRATALDLVPAEMVSSIEVSKAVLPDQDANSLGGSVNIETLTAFDRPERFLSGFLYGIAHQQTTDWGGDQLPFRSNLTYGTRFGADQTFGLVVSGSASRRSFNTSIASPAAWVEEGGFVAPEEFEREVEDNDRQRYALNTNLDWRPSETTQAYARLNFSRFSDDFTNSELVFVGEEIAPTSNETGRYDLVAAELDIPTTNIDEDLAAVTLGLDQQLGANTTLELAGTYSRGTRTRRTFQPEFDGESTAWALTYDARNDNGALTFDNPALAADASNLTYAEMDVEFEDLIENTYQLGGDLRWDFRSGANTGFLKFGGQFRLRDKDIDRNEDPWAGEDLAPTLDQFPQRPPSPLQGGATVPFTGNVNDFLDYWRQITNNGTITETDQFSLDPIESAEEEVEVDAFVTEDVYAGYVMGNYAMGALTATGGVRIEATTTTSERYQFVNDDSFDNAQTELIEAENSYTDVLPSLHLVYRLGDRAQLRGAWSNTIGRPDYDELASFQEIEFEDPDGLGQWRGFIEEGNPDLEPLRSMNFDVSLEFYPGPGSIFSIGGFYKQIDDPIYTFVQQEENFLGGELEGLFGVDLQRAVANIPSFANRQFEEFEFVQLRNANEGTLSGVEINFAQVFDFLPGAFAGLGISSNAAFMQSDVTVPGRDDEPPLFDQSDVVVNITPYYQFGPIELRAAWNYQSEYLASVSDDPFEDEYGDERTTVDLSGRYDLLDGRFQLNAYVRNLTNEVEREFQAVQRRGIFNAETGRTFELGVTIIP